MTRRWTPSSSLHTVLLRGDTSLPLFEWACWTTKFKIQGITTPTWPPVQHVPIFSKWSIGIPQSAWHPQRDLRMPWSAGTDKGCIPSLLLNTWYSPAVLSALRATAEARFLFHLLAPEHPSRGLTVTWAQPAEFCTFCMSESCWHYATIQERFRTLDINVAQGWTYLKSKLPSATIECKLNLVPGNYNLIIHLYYSKTSNSRNSIPSKILRFPFCSDSKMKFKVSYSNEVLSPNWF